MIYISLGTNHLVGHKVVLDGLLDHLLRGGGGLVLHLRVRRRLSSGAREEELAGVAMHEGQVQHGEDVQTKRQPGFSMSHHHQHGHGKAPDANQDEVSKGQEFSTVGTEEQSVPHLVREDLGEREGHHQSPVLISLFITPEFEEGEEDQRVHNEPGAEREVRSRYHESDNVGAIFASHISVRAGVGAFKPEVKGREKGKHESDLEGGQHERHDLCVCAGTKTRRQAC